MTTENSNGPWRTRLLHHLGVALGLIGLILWFWAGRTLGFLDWVTGVTPEGYAGARVDARHHAADASRPAALPAVQPLAGAAFEHHRTLP